jgi:hypothetical protein
MFACEDLGAALRARNAQEAERAARDAVESWLTMHRALRTLELAAIDRGQHWQTARSTIRAYRRALGDLLDRAHVQLAVSSLHQSLAQLRLSLAIANDECTHSANTDRGDDPVGDP